MRFSFLIMLFTFSFCLLACYRSIVKDMTLWDVNTTFQSAGFLRTDGFYYLSDSIFTRTLNRENNHWEPDTIENYWIIMFYDNGLLFRSPIFKHEGMDLDDLVDTLKSYREDSSNYLWQSSNWGVYLNQNNVFQMQCMIDAKASLKPYIVGTYYGTIMANSISIDSLDYTDRLGKF